MRAPKAKSAWLSEDPGDSDQSCLWKLEVGLRVARSGMLAPKFMSAASADVYECLALR